MAGLPPYLSLVNPGEGAPPRPEPLKRAAAEPRKAPGAGEPSAPLVKRRRLVRAGTSSTPAAEKSVLPQAEVVPEEGRTSSQSGPAEVQVARPSSPCEPASPSPPPPPPTKLPRSYAWEKGVTEELSLAFFPPRRFLDATLPLSDIEERQVLAVQDNLVKGIGLTQSYLHLKHLIVGMSKDKRRMEAERDLHAERAKKAEEELSALRVYAEKAKKTEEELSTLRECADRAKKAEQELSVQRELAMKTAEELRSTKDQLAVSSSELLAVKSAHSGCLGALKSVQVQRGKLAEELGEVKTELEATKEKLAASEDIVRRTAKDVFDMTVAQVLHHNPTATLDLSKCHYKAYVYEGQFFPAPPSPTEVSLSEPGSSGREGDGEREAEPVLRSTDGAGPTEPTSSVP